MFLPVPWSTAKGYAGYAWPARVLPTVRLRQPPGRQFASLLSGSPNTPRRRQVPISLQVVANSAKCDASLSCGRYSLAPCAHTLKRPIGPCIETLVHLHPTGFLHGGGGSSPVLLQLQIAQRLVFSARWEGLSILRLNAIELECAKRINRLTDCKSTGQGNGNSKVQGSGLDDSSAAGI